MEAEQWGRRIRAFRKLKGFTQGSLAKELGVSISVVGEIERGNRMPDHEFIEKIATVLHISQGELAPPKREMKKSF